MHAGLGQETEKHGAGDTSILELGQRRLSEGHPETKEDVSRSSRHVTFLHGDSVDRAESSSKKNNGKVESDPLDLESTSKVRVHMCLVALLVMRVQGWPLE